MVTACSATESGVLSILSSPSTIQFPLLIDALKDFLKSCVAVGETWVRILKHSIDLYSSLRNINVTTDDSNITERVNSVLAAIKNASEACACLRLADTQVKSPMVSFE